MASQLSRWLDLIRSKLPLQDLLERLFRETDQRIASIEGKAGDFDSARAELVRATLSRVNEILVPAFELVQNYTELGFSTIEVHPDASIAFEIGEQLVPMADGVTRDLFAPTPLLGLSRTSTPDDWAVARLIDWNSDTGVLRIDVIAVSGDPGPHVDGIVWDSAGSLQAQAAWIEVMEAARDAGIAARDAALGHAGIATGAAGTAAEKATLAADWAEKPEDAEVEAGKFSALHHAAKALAARDLAAQWAEAGEDVEVLPGLFSSRHHALKAAASAAAAATFDPSSYWTKAETYSQGEVDTAIGNAIDALIGGAPGALDTLNEIAAAFGDDENFATTITDQLAGKADTGHGHAIEDITGLADALAAGAGWEEIGSISTASGSQWTFTSIPATYSDLMIVIDSLAKTANAAIQISLSGNNGGAWSGSVSIGPNNQNGCDGGILIPAYGQDAGAGFSGIAGNNTNLDPHAFGHTTNATLGFGWAVAGGIDAVRIETASGNGAGGTIRLLGR